MGTVPLMLIISLMFAVSSGLSCAQVYQGLQVQSMMWIFFFLSIIALIVHLIDSLSLWRREYKHNKLFNTEVS